MNLVLLCLTCLVLTSCAQANSGLISTEDQTTSEKSKDKATTVSTPVPGNREPSDTSTYSECVLPREITPDDAEEIWRLAEQKLKLVSPSFDVPLGAFAEEREYQRTKFNKWTSGFFPAENWLMAKHLKDSGQDYSSWLSVAREWSDIPISNSLETNSHDLGFMVELPLAIATQVDSEITAVSEYNIARERAVQVLTSRWNANIQAHKSSDYNGEWGLIIDSAMNQISLISVAELIQNGEVTSTGRGANELLTRAVAHLYTLGKYLVRPDGSTIHRMIFDPNTGTPKGVIAGQGANADSTWARGQAWAIAGFASAAKLTNDENLFSLATRVADYWIQNVSPECLPSWDLSIENVVPFVPDSGASVIAAYGLKILARIENDSIQAEQYDSYANTLLGTLSKFTTKNSDNPGILLGQTFNVPKDPRSGSYVWGDTFLLLALTA